MERFTRSSLLRFVLSVSLIYRTLTTPVATQHSAAFDKIARVNQQYGKNLFLLSSDVSICLPLRCSSKQMRIWGVVYLFNVHPGWVLSCCLRKAILLFKFWDRLGDHDMFVFMIILHYFYMNNPLRERVLHATVQIKVLRCLKERFSLCTWIDCWVLSRLNIFLFLSTRLRL